MTAQDAIKLVYQSAKGCGHMIKNAETALSMLKNEMDCIEADCGAQLLEPIGKGYARLDLHAAKAKGIPPEKICEIFIESANSGLKGDINPFLDILRKMAGESSTPFPEKELSVFLAEYKGGMVSHSEKYRKEYNPAYRVVMEGLCENLQ